MYFIARIERFNVREGDSLSQPTINENGRPRANNSSEQRALALLLADTSPLALQLAVDLNCRSTRLSKPNPRRRLPRAHPPTADELNE